MPYANHKTHKSIVKKHLEKLKTSGESVNFYCVQHGGAFVIHVAKNSAGSLSKFANPGKILKHLSDQKWTPDGWQKPPPVKKMRSCTGTVRFDSEYRTGDAVTPRFVFTLGGPKATLTAGKLKAGLKAIPPLKASGWTLVDADNPAGDKEAALYLALASAGAGKLSQLPTTPSAIAQTFGQNPKSIEDVAEAIRRMDELLEQYGDTLDESVRQQIEDSRAALEEFYSDVENWVTFQSNDVLESLELFDTIIVRSNALDFEPEEEVKEEMDIGDDEDEDTEEPTLPSMSDIKSKITKFGSRSEDYHHIKDMFQLWHDGIKDAAGEMKLTLMQSLKARMDDHIRAKEAKAKTTKRDARIKAMKDLRTDVEALLKHLEERHKSPAPDLDALPQTTLGTQPPKIGNDGKVESLSASNTLFEMTMPDGSTGLFQNDTDIGTGGWATARTIQLPPRNTNFSGRSVATYQIASLLGVDFIPPTYKVNMEVQQDVQYDLTQSLMGETFTDEMTLHKGVYQGMVMDKLPNCTELGQVKKSQLTKDQKMQLSNIYLFDVLTGQTDRNDRNVLIDENDKLWGIDNDIAFGKKDHFKRKGGFTGGTIAGKAPKDLTIDYDFAMKIIRLSHHEAAYRQTLASLLQPEEIDTAVQRMRDLAVYLMKRINKGQKVNVNTSDNDE